jgi:hypothetical protein
MRVYFRLLGGVVAMWPSVACAQPVGATVLAQVNCDSLPAGPQRTDCYIGLGMMYRRKSEIEAGVAQQTRDIARYHRVTGQHRKPKAPAAKPKD